MLFERILWFEARMNDSKFDWFLEPQEYSSLKYVVWASENYTENEMLSFEEAQRRLLAIGEQYNIQEQTKMSIEEQEKIHKMFLILCYSSNYLLNEVNVIKKNKLALDSADYISLDKIDQLSLDISIGVGLMRSEDNNYSFIIRPFLNVSKMIREIGEHSDNIHVGLHGTIMINEI